VALGEVRLVLERLLEVGNGCVQLPLSAQRDAQVIADFGVIRLQLKRPLVVGNGFIPLPLCPNALPRL